MSLSRTDETGARSIASTEGRANVTRIPFGGGGLYRPKGALRQWRSGRLLPGKSLPALLRVAIPVATFALAALAAIGSGNNPPAPLLGFGSAGTAVILAFRIGQPTGGR